MFCTHFLIYLIHQLYEDASLVPILQMRKVRHRILAWIVQGLSAGEWWSQACHWWSPKVDLMHFTSRCEIFWLCVILLSTEKLTAKAFVIIMIMPKNHQNIFYLQQNFLNAVWGVGLERNFITSTINLMKTGLNYSLLFLGSFLFYLQNYLIWKAPI